MKRWLLGLFCLLLSGAALAAGPRAVRERVQASMLVTGSITVAPDGGMKSYVLDHPEQLPAPVVTLIAQNAPRWRFQPVIRDRVAVSAKAPMSLRIVASDVDMRHWRTVLARAALNATRHWTFVPPTSGPDAAKSSWLVRVPITFHLSERGHPEAVEKYGSWHAYVPGPRNTPPWMHERSSSGSADALATGGVAEVGKGLRLITPLNGA
ncbi:MAG: energy transducer TonB [Rhodanobacter sp.]|nr:MAG: energy transducer TonB [Rhodanobacter sp.]TAL98169.1 MAG: energy transducer TonB [Rhodanobacter sp.]TAM40350.1 MAG: energy transducer TonB [Rhodanobacter sp.]